MTKKIFNSILIVTGSVLLASFIIIMGCLYNYFGTIQENQLKDELAIAGVSVEMGGVEYLEQVPAGRYRITWIAPDGTVLYDSQADAQSLESHADRAEIQEALAAGTGESVRYSTTLLERTMYCAKRLNDGTVLRMSIGRASVGALIVGMIQPFLIVLAIALILSAVLANRLAKRIVSPMNNLDLEDPLENDSYEEFSPLLNRLNRQRKQIAAQMQELRKNTDEFSQIIEGMREGLVLLDDKWNVLSINNAAMRLFGTDASCVGSDFLSVDRGNDMSNAIQSAMKDGHSELLARRNDSMYQFNISRIESDGEILGAVILALSVNEDAAPK